MNAVLLPIIGILINVTLIVLFFSKKHVINKETKIYSQLLMICLMFILVGLITFWVAKMTNDLFLIGIIQKVYMSLLVLLNYYSIKYCFGAAKMSDKIIGFIKPIIITLTIVCITLIFVLPLNVIYYDNVLDGDGMSYNIALVYSVLSFIIFLFITFYLIFKRDKIIKISPFLILLILYLAGFVIRDVYPELIFEGFFFSYILFIMYHTIENPDLKMLRETETAKVHAEKANRAKSDFLASMSHEIRTPLNAIVGLTEDNISYKDELPEVVRENNEDIFNASQTLLEIVGNILDINRIEAEKIEVNPTPYDIREEVEKICKMQSSRIGEKPIQFYQSIAEDVPVELIGDKVLVKQILNNLLSNAIKYTEEGQVKVDINSINRGEDAMLIINVSDTGRGIKKEYIDKLFSKFERLDIEKNTTTQGTGLGLAITKSLVEMMGGKINVQSEFGRGSLFVVTLPQKIGKQDVDLSNTQVLKLYNTNKMKAQDIEEESRQESSNPVVEQVYPSQINKETIIQTANENLDKKSILIVDDNNLNLKVARRAVEALGYEVDEVNSGETCINKLKDKKYDLILMDIMMPGMSGDETLLKLKEDPNFNIPVIAVTADVESDSERKYLQMGFTSYIGKPFTKDQIKIEIDKIFK